MLTNANELIGDIRIGGSLVYKDHPMMEFTLLRTIRQSVSKIKALNFRKTNFQLFKEIANKTLGKLFSWARVQNRVDRHFWKLSSGHKSFPTPDIASQETKAKDQND